MKPIKKIMRRYDRRTVGFDKQMEELKKRRPHVKGFTRPGSRNPRKVGR